MIFVLIWTNQTLIWFNLQRDGTGNRFPNVSLHQNLRIFKADLNIVQAKELEPSFIEIENKNGKNTIVGCIYKLPNMSITELVSDFLEPLLTKISFEKKEVVLLGDYNINLLNCDSDKYTCEFLELMLSFSFLPRIVKPTRITSRSQTLIDNIFLNDISDHLTQFVAIPDIWHNPQQIFFLTKMWMKHMIPSLKKLKNSLINTFPLKKSQNVN